MKTIMDYFRALTPEGRNAQQQQTREFETPSENGKRTDTEQETVPKNEKLSNQLILNEIVNIFHKELLNASFVEVVTFPMSITVVMTQSDFNKFQSYMPLIAELAVKGFYRVIKEEMGEKRSCVNLATYWDVCFVPCIPGVTEVKDEAVVVPENKVVVLATVNDTIEKMAESDSTSNVSVTISGSDIYDNVNVNRAALANIKVVDKSRFQINWDRNMSPEFKQPLAEKYAERQTSGIKQQNVTGTLAQLTCNYNGKHTSFVMERNVCTISGSADERTDATIYKIPCQMVKTGHISIQYIEKSGKFMLAAYGKTIMNNQEVKQSVGSDVNWVELPEQANLNLNGVVMVKFKKNV